MTKKLKVLLLALFGGIIAACTLVGCKVGTPSLEDKLSPYQGGHVTYYANGGVFTNNISVRDLYYKTDNSPFFDISDETGANKTAIDISRVKYDFTGWYVAATYAEGEAHAGEIKYTYTVQDEVTKEETTYVVYPVLDANGNHLTDDTEDRPVFHREGVEEEILEKDVRIVPDMSKPMTSQNIITSDMEMVVCATWKPALSIEYVLVCEEGKEFKSANGDKTYKNGDLITEMAFGRGDSAMPAEMAQVTLEGATFAANYLDEACTTPVERIPRPEGAEPANPKVYCKYLTGKWTVIGNNPTAITNMFNGLGNAENKYYLLPHVKTIDCSNAGAVNPKPTFYQTVATIEGNGCTITGLKFSSESVSNFAAMFGGISNAAVIRNLKIDNVTIDVRGRQSFINAYAICMDIENGATVEGLEISNVTMTVKVPDGTANGQENWLFGKNTDAEFLAEHTGITVSGDNKFIIE